MDWLNSITRADKTDDHGLYVSGYNGHSYKSKTVSRETQKVDSITLSIIGGVQTNRLLEFTKKYSSSGLLARFQLIPIAEKSSRVYKEEALNSAVEARYINLINNLKNIPERFNIIDNEVVKSDLLFINIQAKSRAYILNGLMRSKKIYKEAITVI
nr:DUF3987 domain-containing protein [Francisella orientalis]